jgi:hypothetical protein
MSLETPECIESVKEEKKEVLSFEELIPLVNEKYLSFLSELLEKFKYHDHLAGPLDHDFKLAQEKLVENKFQVIDTIINNFLYCLEQLADHNSDYFIYQKEKVTKKNGKSYKNKLPKIGNRTLLKKILSEAESKSVPKIFKDIIDMFILLTFKNEYNIILFNEDFIDYVKENFDENKNFSKMIMVIDNVNNILDSKLEEIDESQIIEEDSEDEIKKSKSKSKNKKDKNKSKRDIGPDFLKGLENTKIAQLAKNISEKINIDDFPALSDPSKLLSSLGDSSSEGGIQNLLKFVVGEVEGAFKDNTLNEKELIGEAQNLMGQFQNMSGFDPMSLLSGDKDNIDINQFANIFSKMGK